MRKSIKILAVILSVVLLCGIIVTVASAAPAYVAPTAPTRQKTLYDFEADNAAKLPPTTTNVVSTIVNDGTNKYNNLSYEPNGADDKKGETTMGNWYFSNLLSYEYFTVEYDIMADKYSDGTNLISATEYNSLDEVAKAAYYPSYAPLTLYYEFDHLTGTWNTCSPVIKLIDGQWCIAAYTNSAMNNYPLPTKAGVWTHISLIVVPGNTATYTDAEGNTKTCSFKEFSALVNSGAVDKTALKKVNVSETAAYLYVNGEYAFEIPGFANTSKDTAGYDTLVKTTIKYGRFKPTAGSTWSGSMKDPYSVNFDNIALYTYADGYKGDLTTALANQSTIRYCDDTPFNVNYPYPAGTDDSATVIGQDGSVESYYIYEAALNATSEYCILSLNKDADVDCKPAFPFYVQTNGYKFTLAYDSTYLLEEADEEGLYLLREATPEDYGTIVWDEGGPLETTTSVIGGITPKYPTETGLIKMGASYKLVEGWSTTKNSVYAENIPAAVAGETIKLYPVYTDLAFAVVDADGNVVKGYADAKDIIKAVNSPIPDTTIVLYSDIELAECDVKNTAIPFTVTKSVTIDLNGHRLSRFCYVAGGNAGQIFQISGYGASVYLYSSVPGGEVLVLNYKGGTNYGGAELFICSGTNATIKLGDGTQNLTVNAPMLLHTTGGNSELIINGGSYFNHYRQSDGFVFVRGGSTHIDFKNATVGTQTDVLALFSAKSSGNARLYGEIDNCLLYAGSIFFAFHDMGATPNEFFVTNSDIFITNMDRNAKGVTMYLGDNVRYNKNIVNFATMPGCTTLDMTETVDTEVSYYRTVTFDAVGDDYVVNQESVAEPDVYKRTFTTIATTYSNSRFGTVQWYDNNGNLLSESLAWPGMEAVFDGDTSGMYGAQATPYTAKTFSAWTNIWGNREDGSIYDLTVLGGVVNKFVAECEGDAVPYVRPSYNLATSTSFVFNFYLPYDENTTIDSVIVDGVEVLDTARISQVKVGGVKYYKVTTTPGACEVNTIVHTVTYTNELGTNTQTFELSVESYFETVLSNDAYTYADKQLAATALSYCNAVYNYVNGETYAPYDALITKYQGYVKSVSNAALRADAELDMSAIKDTVTGAMFSIGNGYKPSFGFTVADGVESVTFTIVTNRNGATETYTVTQGTNSPEGILASGADIPAYDIRETITITVGEATGTFNLAAYVVFLQSLEPTTENVAAINLCKALYAYSIASLEYKLS